MVRRDITQLAVCETQQELDSVPFECLRKFYLDKTSEIIYFTKEKKLYGIVCTREAISGKDIITINKSFTVLQEGDIVKACRTFQSRKTRIHKIPIVNAQGELVGDYSSWDDMLYIERNRNRLMRKESVKKVLGIYHKIYMVKPIAEKLPVYMQLTGYLERFGIEYLPLDKEQIAGKLSEKACFIFADEDERRGTECLFQIEPCFYDIRGKYIYEYDMLASAFDNLKFVTYKSLMVQIMYNNQFETLQVKKPDSVYSDLVDDKVSFLLSALNKRGVNCFCIYNFEDKDVISDYCKEFQNEVKERMAKFPRKLKKPWPQKDENPDFFDDLYQNPDYEKEIVQRETFFQLTAYEYKNGIEGKYCNAKNGRRVTCFQPEEYIGTIYTFGRCMMLGVYAEDQNAITSILQKKLMEAGYAYRVENCADMVRADCSIDERLREIGKFNQNDIIVFFSSPPHRCVGIQGIALEQIFEKHQIPSTWVEDTEYGHCNHKANRIIADEILEMVKPCLVNKPETNDREVQFCIHEEMKNYVYHRYIEHYFSDFAGGKYASVGAIVMDCDPFSIEHRYWIEWASRQVEFLILFIFERDVLTFSFEERYKMVIEGTKDIDNIMVVPSGACILSDVTFLEYFSGDKNAVIYNARNDLNVFADYIAELLHITHRFVGNETERESVKIYNEEMKRILPQKGISCVEMPAMPQGQAVCAPKAIRYLRNKEYDKAFELLPETTQKYIMNHLYLTEELKSQAE